MTNKDWKWNTQSVMATLNSSNNTDSKRADYDYYATPAIAVEKLLEKESIFKHVMEPACWEGHISKELEKSWLNVISSDIVDRKFWEVRDFLSHEDFSTRWHWDIVTNPPFAMATEFLEKSMSMLVPWRKLIMLLRIQFLEWVKRNEIFKTHPPKRVYVFSRNIRCAKNGDFENATWNASTYCWFVWEKWYTGKPEIEWLI